MSEPRIRLYPPHFDAVLSRSEAEEIASNPSLVASHAFMPFLQRIERWTQHAQKGTSLQDVKRKERKIRYACRCDSYIFSYYRNILNKFYEQELDRLELRSCVTAYRKIPTGNGRSGKCNIHFAKEAFGHIQAQGNCLVFALDIKQFFENLDHTHLKQVWWRLLGKPKQRNGNHLLPEDHFSVFKAVTSYSYISMEDAYKTLGYIGNITTQGGKTRIGYLVKRKEFPKQICSGKQFREKLASKIEQNSDPFGIPQGSPISDLLANMYLLDFDNAINTLVLSMGGTYRRYSDDILLVLPTDRTDVQSMLAKVLQILNSNAPRLALKDKKTQVYRYRQVNGIQENDKLIAAKGSDGLEYLGFRYDGERIYLRNSTVSGIQRKITLFAKGMARRHLEENPGIPLDKLIETFNYSALIAKFGRVKDYDPGAKDYTKWTFWTYIKRSGKILGTAGKPIARQMSNYKQFARNRAQKAIKDFYR